MTTKGFLQLSAGWPDSGIVHYPLSPYSLPTEARAHPMPNSVVLLNVHADRIDAEMQIPLIELQAACGHAVNDSSAGLVARLGPQLRAYLTQHIRPKSPDGRPWRVSVGALAVQETQNPDQWRLPRINGAGSTDSPSRGGCSAVRVSL